MSGTDAAERIEAFDPIEASLRALCMGYPEAYEDHPWGETVYKVKGKVFVFMGQWKGTFGVTTKLPESGAVALMLPFAEPTGYGLGKSGWVSARFRPDEEVPLDMLAAWIDESYRAIAPKKLVASLPAPGAAPPVAAAAAATTTAKGKPAAAKGKLAAKVTPTSAKGKPGSAKVKRTAKTTPAAKARAAVKHGAASRSKSAG